MKYQMPDGSMAEMTVEEYAQLVAMGLVAKPVVESKTQAEMLREAFDKAPVDPDALVMPAAEEPEPVDENLPAPAKMPRHIEMPPVAWVTQSQALVVELLRHHPLGLKTKDIAEKLRWDHPKATRITTGLERGFEGAPKLVRRVPGHYRYALSEIGRRSAFKITGQPARMREKVNS